eukprot:SAG31_NODE_763_length_12265_cov_3.024984_4_plen_113_part_00
MATLVAQAIVHCAMWTSFHGRELEETIREKKNDQSLWAFLFNLDSQDRPDVQYYNARLQFEQLLATSRFALKMTDVARGVSIHVRPPYFAPCDFTRPLPNRRDHWITTCSVQ